MKCSRLPAVFCLLLLVSCQAKVPEDPRVAGLQQDVAELREQNNRMEQELRQLQDSVASLQTQTAPQTTATAQAPPRPAMTSERMKREVTPVLEAAIRKIKASTETPRKGSQYGMRIEYDLKHAVFGLVQSKDRKAPYAARVLVPYQKFLESENESRSYGSGTQEFRLAYRGQKWVLEDNQR